MEHIRGTSGGSKKVESIKETASIGLFLNPVNLLKSENINDELRLPSNKLVDFECCIKKIFDNQFYARHVPNDQTAVSGCEFLCRLIK